MTVLNAICVTSGAEGINIMILSSLSKSGVRRPESLRSVKLLDLQLKATNKLAVRHCPYALIKEREAARYVQDLTVSLTMLQFLGSPQCVLNSRLKAAIVLTHA